MLLITEIQNNLFNHPYFTAKIIKTLKLEKESDGRLRAFKFVEK